MGRSDHLTSAEQTKSAHKEWKFYMVRLRFGRGRPDLRGGDKVTGSIRSGFADRPENRSHPLWSPCAQLRTGVSDRVPWTRKAFAGPNTLRTAGEVTPARRRNRCSPAWECALSSCWRTRRCEWDSSLARSLFQPSENFVWKRNC